MEVSEIRRYLNRFVENNFLIKSITFINLLSSCA